MDGMALEEAADLQGGEERFVRRRGIGEEGQKPVAGKARDEAAGSADGGCQRIEIEA